MPDEKPHHKPDTLQRINLREPREVRYWTHSLDVTEDRLREAVRAVGTLAVAVKKYLGR
jgi:hypothetical protein